MFPALHPSLSFPVSLSFHVPKPRVLHDEYFKLAKERGYVARSAFKLLEIQQTRRIIRPSDRVLDLGCAPGSWLQVLDEVLGPRGVAAGIDLSPVTARLSPRIRTMQGDIYKTAPEVLLALGGITPEQAASGLKFDVVISDMAPNTSGHGDDFMSARLCDRTLDLLPGLLRSSGNVLMKVLEGIPTPEVIARTKSLFGTAGTTKPRASRDVSREIFIWGFGYRGATGLLPSRSNRVSMTQRRQAAPPAVNKGWSTATQPANAPTPQPVFVAEPALAAKPVASLAQNQAPSPQPEAQEGGQSRTTKTPKPRTRAVKKTAKATGKRSPAKKTARKKAKVAKKSGKKKR